MRCEAHHIQDLLARDPSSLHPTLTPYKREKWWVGHRGGLACVAATPTEGRDLSGRTGRGRVRQLKQKKEMKRKLAL